MQHLVVYLAGLALGLGLIFPIGPINLFVMRQGITLGWRKAWPAVLAIAINDTVMIALGAVLGTAATTWIAGIQRPLMFAGAVYLTMLGVRYLRATESSLDPTVEPAATLRQRILLTIGLVWLNPHALFDVFGVLGNAIGTRDAPVRLAFALGVVSASWLWYATLTWGAGAVRHRLTAHVALLVDRLSGLLLLLFAGAFWFELVR